MKMRIAFQTIMLLVCCGFLAAQEPPAGSAKLPFAGATVSDFKGSVDIQLPGKALHAPSRGEVLPAETTVNTQDGRLLLRLSDGSNLLVRPNTRLVLKQPEAGGWRYLQLLLGRVRAEVQKRLGGSSGFQMGTPSAVISVRGTKFEVEVNREEVTEVDVHEGVVQLDSAKGLGESVMIRAGFSSRVGFDAGPESPRPTRDMRPELDRPGRDRDRHSGDDDDDSIKRLRASSSDHHEGSDSHDVSGGGSNGTSGGSDTSSDSGSNGSNDSDQSGSGRDTGDRSRHGDGKPPTE
ncbi:MAG TPA: FecR family protein [Terriglobales bacterium]|nr:FecR family protein [Terriglobales bacterium]